MATIGEYRVGIDFNPSGNPQVHEIKSLAAQFIDVCHAGTDKTEDPEVGRLWSLAMTHMEDAAMWAVKAVTKKAQE